MKEPIVSVAFKGSSYWSDNLYGTGLDFAPGQARDVPASVAANFRRHPDVFQVGDAKPAPSKADKEADKNDTEEKLAKASKKKTEDDEKENRHQDMVMQVRHMSLDQLRDFAERQFNQKLHHNLGKEKALEKVMTMVDQYRVD